MTKALSTLIELRRRKVFRGIGYYLVGAWTLLQVAEVVVEPAGLPAWTLTALLYLAVIGFPLAVWLAWRFELTDHGLVRTRPATESDANADYALKTSDYVIFVAMLAVIGAIAWQGLGSIRSEAVETQARVEADAEAEREAVENSIAVLPFSDLSQNADQAYLGDGISDTVLHVLSQVTGLTVSARTSSFAFRNRDMTVEEIAGQLGVAHVLEGSVQRAGDQVRIIARLIDARNSRELWSGNFDREPQEIFAIQDEIAREVVAALQITVLEDDRERLETQYQPALAAFEQYVIGRRELDSGTAAGTESAVQRFETAIEIDPDYALAYAALAHAVRRQAIVGGKVSWEDMREKEEALIETALDLDPTLAEAWTAKALMQAEDKQFDKAEESIKKALDFNPNSAEAWGGYWNFLIMSDRWLEALNAIQKAAELDPESISLQSSLAQQLFTIGRAEEAIYVLRENTRKHPDAPDIYNLLVRFLNQVGKPGEAMWYLQSIYRRDPENSQTWSNVCLQHWQLWDTDASMECLTRYSEAFPDDLDSKKQYDWLAGNLDEVVRIGYEEIKQMPNSWYPKMQVCDALAELGEWEQIIALVEAAFPDLMTPEPNINDWSQWGARRLAEALLKTGQVEQGLLLADQTLAFIERSRKMQAGGWISGVEDAQLYALKGEDERAMDLLEQAIDRDWMFYANGIVFDSAFDNLQDNPRFMGLINKLEQRMARERQWYEDHKDDLQL